MFEPFSDVTAEPHIRGFLHTPAKPNGSGVVLTHGAGANCQSKLLIEMSEAFAAAGFFALRMDLPFRIERPHGPPSPGGAARDREGLRRAVALLKEKVRGPIFLGGHSYGGRQSTMLAAEDSETVDALLLLSYPLHPPRKPEQLRTSHFPKLKTPAFFVSGARDPFGTIEEIQSALTLIPTAHVLHEVEGAGHDLAIKKSFGDLPERIVSEFQVFAEKSTKPAKSAKR
jgi:predicted alpha/beta-hydrolase family hydrolase